MINGADVHAHPNRFFIAARLAAGRLAPKPAEHFPFDIWHGYHFDAALLGQFLQRKAVERGVRHLVRHVTQAKLDGQGAIESRLDPTEGDAISADFFVDCTGFAGLLIDKALRHAVREFCRRICSTMRPWRCRRRSRARSPRRRCRRRCGMAGRGGSR